jgi:8-oxo-dGTP diphosphatase
LNRPSPLSLAGGSGAGVQGARASVQVAVGILHRADGAVLMADRPAGKPYAGYWEFPGGKIEPGEAVDHALARELAEELGIRIGESLPWVVFEHDYPHAYVRLHFRRIFDWTGTPQALDGQRVAFHGIRAQSPEPLLPAAHPVMRWLKLPDRLRWSGRLRGGDTAGEPREHLIDGERWLACEVRNRRELREAAARGADFAVAAALALHDLADLCREAPIPVYVRDPGDAAVSDRLRRLGAHGLAG